MTLKKHTVLNFLESFAYTHTQTGFTKSVLGISEALLTSIALEMLCIIEFDERATNTYG